MGLLLFADGNTQPCDTDTWKGGGAARGGTYTHEGGPVGTTTCPGGARRCGGGAKAEMMGFLTNETAAFRVACNWARLSCCRSFLWAFWCPPSACEFANSLQQYWHSYFRSPEEGGKASPAAESGDSEGEVEVEVEVALAVESSSATTSSFMLMSKWSSWTLNPKSFRRVGEVGFVLLAL